MWEPLSFGYKRKSPVFILLLTFCRVFAKIFPAKIVYGDLLRRVACSIQQPFHGVGVATQVWRIGRNFHTPYAIFAPARHPVCQSRKTPYGGQVMTLNDSKVARWRGIFVGLGMLTLYNLGCDSVAFIPKTCEELHPSIVELSEGNNTGILNISVLKMYEIEEIPLADTDMVLNCQAIARLDNGGETKVNFYITRDEDGDYFQFYQLQ